MKMNRAPMAVADKLDRESRPIRVLVVEDQSLFRDGLTNLLSGQPDLEVIAATDSLSVVLEQITKVRPDIALIGWAASSPDSQKVFSAIQESKAPTRVIMLVKDEKKEDFVEAGRQGGCGIVPKQTSTELLLKSIRKVHAGEFWLDRLTPADVIRRLAKRAGTGPVQ